MVIFSFSGTCAFSIGTVQGAGDDLSDNVDATGIGCTNNPLNNDAGDSNDCTMGKFQTTCHDLNSYCNQDYIKHKIMSRSEFSNSHLRADFFSKGNRLHSKRDENGMAVRRLEQA